MSHGTPGMGGIPRLAKGSDPTLADLAKQDRQGPATAQQQVELGDAWWKLAESYDAAEKDKDAAANLRARAAFWYRRALPSLSGLTRDRVEKHLAETAVGAPVENTAQEEDGMLTRRPFADEAREPANWREAYARRHWQFHLELELCGDTNEDLRVFWREQIAINELAAAIHAAEEVKIAPLIAHHEKEIDELHRRARLATAAVVSAKYPKSDLPAHLRRNDLRTAVET